MQTMNESQIRSGAWMIALASCAATLVAAEPTTVRAQGIDGVMDVFGPDANPLAGVTQPPERNKPPKGEDPLARLRYWNEVMQSANALDHTPVQPGESRVFGEQVGPGRTTRAFAIVHIAIADALIAIDGRYRSYTGLARSPAGTSRDAAIAQAAHDALVALYPSQRARLDGLLQTDLAQVKNGSTKKNGIDLGKRAASTILARRANDGSQHAEPCVVSPCPTGGAFYPTSDAPGRWRQDPISRSPLALGAFWDGVTPFAMSSALQFPPPAPPALTSPEYAAAFDEVKRLGGDGLTTPTERSAAQTVAGIYWAYDGTPGLGTPPRLYNQIAVQIAMARATPVLELARLLALLNLGMADAGIACWQGKYEHAIWRPVSGVREADETGPTGQGDGNPATLGDPTFTPLGAPASNLDAPNFTPPFPAYTSGHSTFGSVLFQTLRRFYATDAIAFTFVSDEFNGVTRDNTGTTRPRLPRTFANLTAAEEENGQSRIYLGIHWAFDKTGGALQGRAIADHALSTSYTPVP